MELAGLVQYVAQVGVGLMVVQLGAFLQFVFETLPTLGEYVGLNTFLPWRWKDTLLI